MPVMAQGSSSTGAASTQSTSAPATTTMGAGPDINTTPRRDNDRDLGWIGLLGLAGLLGLRRKRDDHSDARRSTSTAR